MRDYFRHSDSDDEEGESPSVDPAVRTWLSGAVEWRKQPRQPDSIERLRARLLHG
jgi:hypothetical protein